MIAAAALEQLPRSGPVASLMLQEAREAPARIAEMLARDERSYGDWRMPWWRRRRPSPPARMSPRGLGKVTATV